ncbi:MAG: UDP-N-acetyl-D-glucosamine 2-epimerase, UDP-hydrolysing [Candidatus Yanofskybacteria bacterium RIFCSPLOWO2_02_FULL_45_10]|uniref:UDP-N-acetyl-D-glucosamine 2-epimerase, UDP-hydrolysing n=3 Tax=Patescibacteria group TaxID=1783273 RepID=A0A1F8G485_9BACT|nr:MAG: UDP-N-acetylglucosamine 2-epimerase [Candidatus Daviesbacteria bacterium GW2011_GWB1_41_5]OGN19556.1 MAG: UDP-N-acetyl-D-glucosamine 2-epimerase, UDP-hydrolysing [Candidatus Yanofskybacteria bacterium RIFCSPHIGHO2_12_FULL_45_19b]OGN32479.1 MAG: UDP-N-acetyl-D-glucosamine 2-epimerase, UDP-hydrolysing [Candidatus Yanofskybacteria bacterium RIFCSPLOWO2_02_FULL_45_10]
MEDYLKKGRKRVVFLTGTRADFGKLKSLILALRKALGFDVQIFATGMHMLADYGYTVNEIEKCGIRNIYKYISYSGQASQEVILASTMVGFGNYIKEFKPDLIIVHGDRLEALAGALAGSFNNVLVAHIEGGELSGTLDGHIRHAITKLSNIHFVANGEAKTRVKQLGEDPKSIFEIGSPDVDVMLSKKLPTLTQAKKRYAINYDHYAILLYHPVTTELGSLERDVEELIRAMVKSEMNYIVIHPNNDPGSDIIRTHYYGQLAANSHFRLFPSLRFEYFLTILRHAHFIIGNSSSAVREAPYFGVPALNVGTRQADRIFGVESVSNHNHQEAGILAAIKRFSTKKKRFQVRKAFGRGNSDKNFVKVLEQKNIWQNGIQKKFNDINKII